MPDALGAALEGYRVAFRELGGASLCRPRLEADDLIATIACKAVAAGASAVILSTHEIFLGLCHTVPRCGTISEVPIQMCGT